MKNYTIPKNLLSKGATNTKTAKNEIKTFILYLAPHKQNDKNINLCTKASKGCVVACLYTAGRGKFSNVQKSRINKANFYIYDKINFIKKLSYEITREVIKARKEKTKVAFRLNGTSDIDFVYLLKKYGNLDISKFSDVALFYDYTKILGKVKKYINHPNYFLTFSRSEDNEAETLEALKIGASVAVVFKNKLPLFWKSYKVIDGDKTDLQMYTYYNTAAPVVLGLVAKGEGKKDKSGFVVDQNNDIDYSFLKEIKKETQNNWIDSRVNTFGKINLY